MSSRRNRRQPRRYQRLSPVEEYQANNDEDNQLSGEEVVVVEINTGPPTRAEEELLNRAAELGARNNSGTLGDRRRETLPDILQNLPRQLPDVVVAHPEPPPAGNNGEAVNSDPNATSAINDGGDENNSTPSCCNARPQLGAATTTLPLPDVVPIIFNFGDSAGARTSAATTNNSRPNNPLTGNLVSTVMRAQEFYANAESTDSESVETGSNSTNNDQNNGDNSNNNNTASSNNTASNNNTASSNNSASNNNTASSNNTASNNNTAGNNSTPSNNNTASNNTNSNNDYRRRHYFNLLAAHNTATAFYGLPIPNPNIHIGQPAPAASRSFQNFVPIFPSPHHPGCALYQGPPNAPGIQRPLREPLLPTPPGNLRQGGIPPADPLNIFRRDSQGNFPPDPNFIQHMSLFRNHPGIMHHENIFHTIHPNRIMPPRNQIPASFFAHNPDNYFRGIPDLLDHPFIIREGILQPNNPYFRAIGPIQRRRPAANRLEESGAGLIVSNPVQQSLFENDPTQAQQRPTQRGNGNAARRRMRRRGDEQLLSAVHQTHIMVRQAVALLKVIRSTLLRRQRLQRQRERRERTETN